MLKGNRQLIFLLKGKTEIFTEKRFIFESSKAETQPEKSEKTNEGEPTMKIGDIKKALEVMEKADNLEVSFEDLKTTIDNLAKKLTDKEEEQTAVRTHLLNRLGPNFAEQMKFWNERTKKGIKTIRIEKSANGPLLNFYTEGKTTVEVQVNMKGEKTEVKAEKTKVAKEKSEGPRMKIKENAKNYVEQKDGKMIIHLKKGKEENKVKLTDIFDNLKAGDRVYIKAPNKPTRVGVYNGTDDFTYSDKPEKHAIILNNYIVSLEPIADIKAPTKTIEKGQTAEEVMTAFQKKSEKAKDDDKEIVRKKENQVIDTTFKNFFKENGKKMMNQDIAELINDHEKWVAAWEQGKIVGLEKIKQIIQEEPVFAGITQASLRENIYELITIGYNDQVDLEDIFDHFQIYENAKKEKGSYGQFKNEYEKTQKEIEKLVIKDEKGLTPQEDQRLTELNKKMIGFNDLLRVSGKMLESLGKLKSNGEISKAGFGDRYKQVLSRNQGDVIYSKEFKKGAPFYPMHEMVSDNADPDDNLDYNSRELMKIGISREAINKFEEVATAAGAKDKFKNSDDKLRVLLRLYSVPYLRNEGCIVPSKEEDKFVLVKIPAKFESNNPEIVKLFKDTEDSNLDIKDQNVRNLRESLDESERCLGILNRIFNRTQPTRISEKGIKGKKIAMEDISAGAVIDYTKDYFDQQYAGAGAFGEVRDRVKDYENGKVPVWKEAKTVAELNRLMKEGLVTYIARLDESGKNKEGSAFLAKYGTKEKALEELTLKDLKKEPTKEQADLIRTGFVESEKNKEKRDVLDLSSNADFLKAVDKKLKELNVPEAKRQEAIARLRKSEIKVTPGLGVFVNTVPKGTQVIVGGGATIELYEGLTLNIAGGINTSNGVPGLGVTLMQSGKISENVNGSVGIAAGTGAVGVLGGFDWALPDTSWRMGVNAGVGIGPQGYGVGAGLTFGHDNEKARKDTKEEVIRSKKIDYIDSAPAGQKMERIKTNVYFGDLFKQLDTKGFSNDEMIKFYEAHKDALFEEAEKGRKIPPITSFGAGLVYTGEAFSSAIGTILSPIGYLTINIGSKVVISFKESPHTKKMDLINFKQQNEKFMKEIQAKYPGKTISIEEKFNTLSTPELAYDKDGNVGTRQSEVGVSAKDLDNIAKANESLKDAGIVLDPPDETGLIQVHALGTNDKNVQICVDSGLQKTGLILKGNKIYLAAGLTPTIAFRRSEYYFPYSKEGAFKEVMITMSNNPVRSPMDIRANSAQMIYKHKNDQYQILAGAGEVATNLAEYENYKNGKTRMYTGNELYKDTAISERAKEGPVDNKVRAELFEPEGFLATFIKNNQVEYRKLTTPTDDVVDYSLNKLVAKINEGLTTESKTKLNAAEVEAVQLKLMNDSFVELGNDPEKRKKTFNKHLDVIENKVLIPRFEQKLVELKKKGMTFKYNAEDLAKAAIEDIRETKLEEPPTAEDMNTLEGAQLAVAAGTEHIFGLRSIASYKRMGIPNIRDGILNVHEYRQFLTDKTNPIRTELAQLLLETMSPLEKADGDDQKFIKSPLALKIARNEDSMKLALGESGYAQIKECFDQHNTETFAKNRAAFDHFKKLVSEIRKAELNGEDQVTFQNWQNQESTLYIDLKFGDGAYEKCGNYSMFMKEKISMKKPKGITVYGAQSEANSPITRDIQKGYSKFSLFGGVSFSVPKGEAPPTVVVTPEEAPKSGANVREGTGGAGVTAGGGTDTGGGADTGNTGTQGLE